MENKLTVTRNAGFFTPNVQYVSVKHRHGFVFLLVDGKVLEMRTPAAHATGFALVKEAGLALDTEFVVLEINGAALNFPTKSAKQIGAALLRKADAADDFQKRIH